MARDILSWDTKGLPEFQDLLDDMGEKGAEGALDGCHDWLDYTFEIAQRNVPVDTGDLAGSGDVNKTRWGGSIFYKAAHALAVHFGYVRHLIKPKRKDALRWEAKEGGKFKGRLDRLNKRGRRKDIKWAFSKGHMVPGRSNRSKPQPWLDNAIRAALEFLPDFMLDGFNKKVGGG